MNKGLISTISAAVLVSACGISPSLQTSDTRRDGTQVDLFPGVTPGNMRFITAEEARQRNVAHMVIRYKGKVMGICHFGKVYLPIDNKIQTFVGTAGHCIDSKKYQNPNGTPNNRVDYVLARSLTKLFPKESGFEVITTDNPITFERSDLYGRSLHGANVEMTGCLPHGDGKNLSTCFHFSGNVQMRDGIDGKATVFFDRNDYISLLQRANRNCEEAYISGVSGNYFTDQFNKMVGYASTAVNACYLLYNEKVKNTLGIPLRVNAFPITFEPMRHPGTNGKSTVILN